MKIKQQSNVYVLIQQRKDVLKQEHKIVYVNCQRKYMKEKSTKKSKKSKTTNSKKRVCKSRYKN